MKTSTLLGILIVLVGALLLWYELVLVPAARTSEGSSPSHNVVTYYCDEGTLAASYSTSSVTVTFPDGSSQVMPQTMSGSGIRYEASSTVFWSKGNDAFVTVGGANAYNNCVAGSVIASGGTSTYTDASGIFSFSYPSQFTLSGGGIGYSTEWMQNATSSGMLLAKVSVPASYEPGTNFASSRFTLGASSDPSAVASCQKMANPSNATSSQVAIDGVPFTKITYSGAGAGNFYEYTSYRTDHEGECYAIEYVIHSLNIHNFPSSAGIKEFDRSAVQQMFEGMVQSFKFLQ